MLICICNLKLIDWIQVFGTIATVGTFVFLIIDRKNLQRQIDELAKLAQTAELRLKLSVMPNFSELKIKPFTGSIGSMFGFELKNIGGKAVIKSVIEKNNKLIINSGNPVVQTEGGFVVNANAPNENPLLSEYEIEIKFTDIIGGTYSQIITIKQQGKYTLELAKEI
jgi:hypothetical protein